MFVDTVDTGVCGSYTTPYAGYSNLLPWPFGDVMRLQWFSSWPAPLDTHLASPGVVLDISSHPWPKHVLLCVGFNFVR